MVTGETGCSVSLRCVGGTFDPGPNWPILPKSDRPKDKNKNFWLHPDAPLLIGGELRSSGFGDPSAAP